MMVTIALQMVKRFDKASRDYHYIQEQDVSDERIERHYMQCLEEMDTQDGWQVEQEARIILE